MPSRDFREWWIVLPGLLAWLSWQTLARARSRKRKSPALRRAHNPRMESSATASSMSACRHHAQVHRQQCRDRRHLGPVAGEVGAPTREAELAHEAVAG